MVRQLRPVLIRALLWIGLAAVLAATSARAQISTGATKDEVIKILGWPRSTSHSEEREILNYAECTVMMKDGRLEKLIFKNPDARIRLWNQITAPQSSAPANRPVQVSPPPVQPKDHTPPPQAVVADPPPTKIIEEPRPDSGAGFVRTLMWVGFALLVALLVLTSAIRGSRRWGQLQKDLLRKKVSQPAQPMAPAFAHAFASKRKPDPLLDGWSLELLKQIEWHRFEQIVAAYEKATGHESKLTEFGPDGGIDVRVFDKDSGQLIRISQCKAFDNQRVDVKLVREFYGVMMHEKINSGGYYTTSNFTPDAVAFAQGKGLELIDGANFISKIKQLDLTSQLKLFEIATDGDYLTPTCANCGIKMVLKAEHGFWGCVNYPRCRNKIFVSRASRS